MIDLAAIDFYSLSILCNSFLNVKSYSILHSKLLEKIMAQSKSSGFFKDFQAFIMRGNVVELAVAVIIGGAFGKIISSLVEDIITPAILQPVLTAARLDQLSELSINGIKYGVFLAAVLNFLVVAFTIFLMIRALEKAQRRIARAKAIEESIEAEVTPDPVAIAQERLTTAMERLATVLENQNK